MREMVWTATREDVMAAVDYKETAHAAAQIDRALDAATGAVYGLTRREFAPMVDTRWFDWPDQYARPWRLWLDSNEAISLTEVYSNGAVIPPENWFLRRADARNEPPFTYLELNLDTSAAFGGSTMQRAIRLAGVWGWSDEQAPAGTVVLPAGATDTAITVSNGAAVGVGSLLTIGAERLEVTGRAMADTGQTLAADLPETKGTGGVAVAVTDGSQFNEGEAILIDAERLMVDDIAGDTLVVRRAWDGSVLAAHTAGTPVWASRRLTVTRGARGTTAASIAADALVTVWQPPGLARTLTIAEAINIGQQERAGWARNTRSATGTQKALAVGTQALDTLRQQAVDRYARKARTAAI